MLLSERRPPRKPQQCNRPLACTVHPVPYGCQIVEAQFVHTISYALCLQMFAPVNYGWKQRICSAVDKVMDDDEQEGLA